MDEGPLTSRLAGRRLELRPLAEVDASALWEAVDSSREALKRRLRWVASSRDPEEAARFAREALEAAARGERGVWGLFELRSGRLAGVAGLEGLLEAERASARLSGWVRADRQGRGLATEAWRLLVELGFKKLGLHRLFARIDPSNRAARKVLKKLGFRYEGCLRDDKRLNGRWVDQECWGLLRSEWKK